MRLIRNSYISLAGETLIQVVNRQGDLIGQMLASGLLSVNQLQATFKGAYSINADDAVSTASPAHVYPISSGVFSSGANPLYNPAANSVARQMEKRLRALDTAERRMNKIIKQQERALASIKKPSVPEAVPPVTPPAAKEEQPQVAQT